MIRRPPRSTRTTHSFPTRRSSDLAGLDAIEAQSRSDYKVSADKATPAQQDALLTLAMEDKFPGGADFFDKYRQRSEEHTSELQSLMRISYAVFCLKKKKKQSETSSTITTQN